MYIHYKPNMLTIDWTIYRGVSKTKEDFSRAQLAAFVFNRHNKIFVNASEDDGTLTLQIPAELPVGTYSIMAIWTKNHERGPSPTMSSPSPNSLPTPPATEERPWKNRSK